MRARSRATPSSVMRPVSAHAGSPSSHGLPVTRLIGLALYRWFIGAIRCVRSPAEYCTDVTEALPDTIPSVLERAATQFADRSARRRASAARRSPSSTREATVAAGSSWSASRRRSRRDLGAEHLRMGDRRARRVPRGRGRRVGEHALQGRRGGVHPRPHAGKLLFTVTDFLDTDYVDVLAPGDPVPIARDIVVLRGPTPEGAQSWDEFLAAGCVPSTRARSSGASGRSPATPSPTSSSRRARPAGPRARC